MTRKSEITPSLPVQVQKVSANLQRWGFWGFWSQLVLGIISIVTLLFSTPVLFEQKESNPANQFGILCAFLSIIILAIGVFVFHFRYKKIGKQLESIDIKQRPRKSDTLQLIKFGLVMNLSGMLLAILGAQALIGLSLGKSLTLAPQLIGPDPQNFVNSLDFLIIQANTNTITAHFAGIVSALFLLNNITD